MIGQLIELRYLKVIGGEYPILRLTPPGEAALRDKLVIPLNLRRPIDDQTIERKKAERQAGGTVEYTEQLLSEGLSVEQLASKRGLSPSTIYSHAARLIAAGRVTVDVVVSEDVRKKIEAAIRQVGSVEFLTPIKDLLPDEIEYYVIRCVVEGWKKGQLLNAYDITQSGMKTHPVERAQPGRISDTIIACIQSIPGKLPRSSVAKLLVGSESKRIINFRQNIFCGRLADRRRYEVMR